MKIEYWLRQDGQIEIIKAGTWPQASNRGLKLIRTEEIPDPVEEKKPSITGMRKITLS